MSEQNPTVEDSEEYRALKSLVEAWEPQLHRQTAQIAKRNAQLQRANELIKQFHYGPVTEEYKERVKEYVENEGL